MIVAGNIEKKRKGRGGKEIFSYEVDVTVKNRGTDNVLEQGKYSWKCGGKYDLSPGLNRELDGWERGFLSDKDRFRRTRSVEEPERCET